MEMRPITTSWLPKQLYFKSPAHSVMRSKGFATNSFCRLQVKRTWEYELKNDESGLVDPELPNEKLENR